MHSTVTLTRPSAFAKATADESGTLSHRMGEGWGEGSVLRIPPTGHLVVECQCVPMKTDPVGRRPVPWPPPARTECRALPVFGVTVAPHPCRCREFSLSRRTGEGGPASRDG